jgi:hypothetical protein
MLKLLVRIYAATVLSIATWAWVVEIAMHQSIREHMLPATLLMIITMPLSLALGPLIVSIPFLADGPFAPLLILTFAGILQAGSLIAAQYFFSRTRRER